MMLFRFAAYLVLILFGGVTLSGCAPVTFTQVRTVFEPYDTAENRQERDGVVVELKNLTELPVTFIANVAACDAAGQILVDPFKNPVMEHISFARVGQLWDEVAITNHTGHVIRMNGVVLRLFDPGGGQYEPLTRDDLNAQLWAERPCSTTQQALNVFRAIKVFDRNIEIVPNSTSTFWIPFDPPTTQMAGIWKYSIYEVPVVLNSAGWPEKTTHFEIRMVAKQITETLRRNSPFEPPTVISSSEDSPVAPSQSHAAAPTAVNDAASNRPQPLTKDLIARVQSRLKERGFDPGPADGVMGGRTREALRQFQASGGLSVTGELSPETMKALGI